VVNHAAAGDPFATLGLKRRFALSPQDVAAAYLRTVARLHPDRARDPIERDRLMRESASAGEAKHTLSHDLSRAEVLLEHLGARSFLQASPPASILMEMMELRESAESAVASADVDAIAALRASAIQLAAEVRAELGGAIDGAVEAAERGEVPSDPLALRSAALAWVRLRYLERLKEELAVPERPADSAILSDPTG
jgi:DnaJ-domain-containing protein 1